MSDTLSHTPMACYATHKQQRHASHLQVLPPLVKEGDQAGVAVVKYV